MSESGKHVDSMEIEECGDVLLELSQHFPELVAKKINQSGPINGKWKLVVRSMNNGRVGYFYRFPRGIESGVRDCLAGFYTKENVPEGYPGYFVKNPAPKMPQIIVHDEKIVIWVGGKPLEVCDDNDDNDE